MYYVYLILCADNSIYTGFTDDINRRFFEHKHKKGARHTKLNTPKEILYTEKFDTKKLALKREQQIKRWSRKKKINLIKLGNPNG
jgi:putative endonuclease